MNAPADIEEKQRPSEPAPGPEVDEAVSHLEEGRTLADVYAHSIFAALEAGALDAVRQFIAELHPADYADLLGLLDEDQRARVLEIAGPVEAEVLPELSPDIVGEVVNAMPAEKAAEAIADLDTDDAAFVLDELDDAKRAEVLAELPASERLVLHAALDYEEETAGRLMQRHCFAAPPYWTVGQIIDLMRGSDDLPDRFYEIFVVDPAFRPVGAVPLATLLKTSREVPIEKIMSTEIRRIPDSMDQEEVAYLFEQYNLISAPVVDEDDRLVGMITVDDVVEVVNAETSEDMLALGGVESDAGLSDSVVETVRSRFSWLAVNLATAILASIVIALFDKAIAEVVALAVLMPIVASMGGNAGTQTLTVAVRSLATRELTPANAVRIIWREALVGGANGILFALIMGLLAGVWHAASTGDAGDGLRIGVVIGAAMIINLVCAGLAGILVPLGLQRAGADPAVSSGVFVTTVTDVVGFFVFLGLATLVLL
ncbi:MAG: magnesium transporter [Parvularculaceae bacterium]|nr:magnesium transporter [Parvularculaceae bacterium]